MISRISHSLSICFQKKDRECHQGDDRKGEARKTAVEKYKTDLTKHVKTLLEVSSCYSD